MYYVLKYGFFDNQASGVSRPTPDVVQDGYDNGLKIENAPTKLVFNMSEEESGEPGDFIDTSVGSLVSNKFKEALDSAGVDNVQYVPSEIQDKKTGKIYENFFVANVVGQADCIDMEKSKFTMRVTPGQIREIHELHIDKDKIPRDLKIFIDTRGHLTLVNEEVKNVLESASLKGFELLPAEGYSDE